MSSPTISQPAMMGAGHATSSPSHHTEANDAPHPQFDEIDLMDRLYNCFLSIRLNGPTTLSEAELGSLVNNITFIIRRLQKNALPNIKSEYNLATIPDSEIAIVIGGKNGGFIMSVFVGTCQVIVGEWVNKREQAMAGLRNRCEEIVWKFIKGGITGERNSKVDLTTGAGLAELVLEEAKEKPKKMDTSTVDTSGGVGAAGPANQGAALVNFHPPPYNGPGGSGTGGADMLGYEISEDSSGVGE